MSLPLSEVIAQIRYWHRQRGFAMEQRKRGDLALGSFLRLQLGWKKELPDAERKHFADQAAALMEMGEEEIAALRKKKPFEPPDEPTYVEWRGLILGSILAREPWDNIEKDSTKEMERLAKLLPVWAAFGEDVRGFGPRSLAVIVGEAGDLSLYPKKGHLWKRMGLAVMGDGTGVDDVRQGGLGKSASKDDWIAHGYNAKRRSQMYVIGDVLVKVGERYREIYLARKEFERAKAQARGLIVAPAAKIPKARIAEFISDGHIHKMAQRYMEKRLLKDLWQAWRNEGEAIEWVPKAGRNLLTPHSKAA